MMSKVINIALNGFSTLIMRHKIRKTIGKMCLKKTTYSLIGGKNRRNIFSFKEIEWMVFSTILFNTYAFFLFLLVDMLGINSVKIVMIFWSLAIIVDVLFLHFYLPWKVILNSDEYRSLWMRTKRVEQNEFYTRKPDLVPRREPLIMTSSVVIL